jgi:small subunit ribosomal protein S11
MAEEIENKQADVEATADAVDTSNPLADPAAVAEPVKRAKVRGRAIPVGVAHIRASFNNTQVAISDPKGGVISWSSAGRAGFKGSRKSTAFAATLVAQEAGRAAAAKGMHEVEVRLQGAGAGRESAVRGLQSAGLSVTAIQDITPVPHNGCRPRKRRRV